MQPISLLRQSYFQATRDLFLISCSNTNFLSSRLMRNRQWNHSKCDNIYSTVTVNRTVSISSTVIVHSTVSISSTVIVYSTVTITSTNYG